jgi:hypothetical protein
MCASFSTAMRRDHRGVPLELGRSVEVTLDGSVRLREERRAADELSMSG